MKNVICIEDGQPIRTPEANQNLVNVLSELTEKAQSGEITGAAIVTINKDNIAEFIAAGHIVTYSAIGGLEMVKSFITQELQAHD